jgi:integrase
LLDGIVERGSPITANRTLSWFRRLCSWAIERGLIDANPCTGVKRPAGETARDRVLSDAELKAVWRAADGLEQPYTAFIRLLILTGKRKSEVVGMEWREIDLENRVWTLPAARAKNGREHQIPLSDSAVDILAALPRVAGSVFVFTLKGRNPISAFVLTKQRIDALMPDAAHRTFHDVRRTVASGLARPGVNLLVIEKLLNHVSRAAWQGSLASIRGIRSRMKSARRWRPGQNLSTGL